MEWKDVTDKITELAPGAEALLGGLSLIPGAAVVTAPAAAAVAAISKIFGTTDQTPDAIHAAITADPEAAEKILQADRDYQLAVMKEDTTRLTAQLADVQSARTRQNDHEKATGKSDINLYVLAWTIMGGFFVTIIGIILIAIFAPAVKTDNTILNLLLGSLSTDAGMVVGYFFGSSAGSAAKTDLLAKAEPIKE